MGRSTPWHKVCLLLCDLARILRDWRNRSKNQPSGQGRQPQHTGRTGPNSYTCAGEDPFWGQYVILNKKTLHFLSPGGQVARQTRYVDYL